MIERRRFAATRAGRRIATRFRESWTDLPADAKRRWARGMVAAAGGLVAIAVALMLVARRLDESGALDWEADALRRLEADGPFSFSTAVWLQTFGTDITLWILVVGGAALATWRRKPLLALTLIAGYIGMDLVVRLDWLLWDRARPTLLMGGETAPAFASFPSGHTGKTLTIYGVLLLFWVSASRRPAEKLLAVVLWLALATVVGLGRLRMGVHWPSDVIGGALLGFYWTAALAWALRRASSSATFVARYPSSRKNSIASKSNVE